MKKLYTLLLLAFYMQYATAQTWNITGNSGLTTSNFLGSIDNKDIIFKTNNAEHGRLAATGFWRFGSASNFAKIDSTGKLTFGGNGVYQVAGNKYAFQYAGNPNYGLFFNSTNVQYEFRNGAAVPVFFINANNGNSAFSGTGKIGTYTLPSTDGTNGQVLTTNGTGTVSWSTVSGGSGANTTLSNLAITTAINANLLPSIDNNVDIGSAIKSWKNIYADSSLYLGGQRFLAYAVGTGNENTAVGSGTLNFNGAGSSNTAVGSNALYSNNFGYENVSVGTSALYNNVNGAFNTAVGVGALLSGDSYDNTAVGAWSLSSNITGARNTAIGLSALNSNTSGNWNIAAGESALNSNTTGSSNSAVGEFALGRNETGNENTASGSNALGSNITGSDNTANGTEALYGNTIGYSNVAIGVRALMRNSAGNNLVAVGDSALYNQGISPNGWYFNTAVGSKALFANTTGAGNTALGNQALYNTTTGLDNTASGVATLSANNIGSQNSAYGSHSLVANTSGNRNVAVGFGSLNSNTTGNTNTAIGYSAQLSNTSLSNIVAIGDSALYNLNGGSGHCTALGSQAGIANTTGSNNTYIGYHAGNTITTGSSNTIIGYGADDNAANLSNTTALGNFAACTASNQVRIGNSSVTSIGGQVSWTTGSDERIKTNIRQNVPGLAFINLLKPVTYNYDVDKEDAINRIASKEKQAGKYDIQKMQFTGFLAQEVEKAAKQIGYDFSGVDVPKNDKDIYGLRYSDFVVPLVKAVQELSVENDSLKKQNDVQQKINADQQKQIDDLRNLVLQIQQAQQPGIAVASSTNAIQSTNIVLNNTASLAQNIPNPFTNTTIIAYALPQKFSSAQIAITDKNGKLLKQLNLSAAGKGTIHVDASTLASGAYNYSLYVDGRLIATKQMIATR